MQVPSISQSAEMDAYIPLCGTVESSKEHFIGMLNLSKVVKQKEVHVISGKEHIGSPFEIWSKVRIRLQGIQFKV